MDKSILTKLLVEGKCLSASNIAWRYPTAGDDQRKCPMLGFMFNVEHVAGTLIFLSNLIGKLDMAVVSKMVANDKGSMLMAHDNRWHYPSSLGTEEDNALYKFMIQVHGQGGTLIFVPDPKVVQKVAPLSHRDVFGKTREQMDKEIAGEKE